MNVTFSYLSSTYQYSINASSVYELIHFVIRLNLNEKSLLPIWLIHYYLSQISFLIRGILLNELVIIS